MSERFPPDIGGVARSAGRMARSLSVSSRESLSRSSGESLTPQNPLNTSIDVVTWSRYLQPGEILPPEASPTEHPNIRIHRLGLYRNWDMTLPHTLNLLDWLHQQQHFDAVWGHYLFPAGFVATWFAQLNGLPSIVNARGNDIDRGMFPPGDFARLQWTLANATKVTAVSQEMAKKVETLSQRKAIVLPNVVDDKIFYPEPDPTTDTIRRNTTLKESLGISPEESILGFSGELREKKGQRFLLQALSEVRRQKPACLLIMGELRPESQSLLQAFGQTNPEDAQRIIVTGHLASPEQVAQHLRLCDVYLQPSLWDGMPNALLEAMACGLLCIGSDAGGIVEVITHGETGFVVARSQLHHLGTAILECLALPPEKKETIGQQAARHMATHHTLAQERSRLTTLLDTL